MDRELRNRPATDIELDEIVALYAAIAGSSYVVTARRGERLIGLARAVSDNATICYLQDVLVRPEDDEPGRRAFYETLGYAEIRDHGQGVLRAFVRFDG